jgi:hypothetical protein
MCQPAKCNGGYQRTAVRVRERACPSGVASARALRLVYARNPPPPTIHCYAVYCLRQLVAQLRVRRIARHMARLSP